MLDILYDISYYTTPFIMIRSQIKMRLYVQGQSAIYVYRVTFVHDVKHYMRVHTYA